MPMYEYKCHDCKTVFEDLAAADDPVPPDCPECGSAKTAKIMSAGSVRPNGIPKGSGGFTPSGCPVRYERGKYSGGKNLIPKASKF